MTADALRKAAIRLDLAELVARYTRAVDSLAFDRLAGIFVPEVQVRYNWLPFGDTDYRTQELSGMADVQRWLHNSLFGRTELRRFVSGLEVTDYGPDPARARVQMHERDMRISGTYSFDAVRRDGEWRLQRLHLVEEIHWV